MKRLGALLLCVTASFAVFGCATIVSDSKYAVGISSDPPDAEIRIVNRSGWEVFKGTTPTTVTLEAGAGYFKGEVYTVSFVKDGYVPKDAHVERRVDGWYAGGNLLFGGLIGYLIVDPATGAMWTLKDLHVSLQNDTHSGASSALNVLSIDDLPAQARTSLLRVE